MALVKFELCHWAKKEKGTILILLWHFIKLNMFENFYLMYNFTIHHFFICTYMDSDPIFWQQFWYLRANKNYSAKTIKNLIVRYIDHSYNWCIQWILFMRRWCHAKLSMFRAVSNLTVNEAQWWAAMGTCSFSVLCPLQIFVLRHWEWLNHNCACCI